MILRTVACRLYVHGILQAGILEWVAIPFSRGTAQSRNQTRLLHCGQIPYHLNHRGSHEATRESANHTNVSSFPSICLLVSAAAVYTLYIALFIIYVFAGKCCMVNAFLYEDNKNKPKNPPELYRDGKNSIKMSCVCNFIQHSLNQCLTA